MRVKAQPSGCIPRASVSVYSFRLGFFFLICWIWFYLFNAVVFVFLIVCSPPARRCCLKCRFRGHATHRYKTSGAVLLLIPHP